MQNEKKKTIELYILLLDTPYDRGVATPAALSPFSSPPPPRRDDGQRLTDEKMEKRARRGDDVLTPTGVPLLLFCSLLYTQHSRAITRTVLS